MERRGRPAPRPADVPVASDARAGLASDPDGYFCALEEGRIRGMVSALVRGRVWYLSMFFVLPGDQGRGLGRALLERALAYGEARGAEIRCTWATLDPRAQARYVMAGMAPRWPIYLPPGWRCGGGRATQGASRARPAGAGAAVRSRRRREADRRGLRSQSRRRPRPLARRRRHRGGDRARRGARRLRLPARGADRAGGGARRDGSRPGVRVRSGGSRG